MLALGLVLLIAGVLVLPAGIFTAGSTGDTSLLGIAITRYRGSRQLRRRTEHRCLEELAREAGADRGPRRA